MSIARKEPLHEQLVALGVSESLLTEEEKDSLDKKGFVVFDRLMEPAYLERLRERYEAIMSDEGIKDKDEEPGTRRPHDLVNKGDVFDGPYTHPQVLAAVYHVLQRNFKLSNYCGRDALPGQGQQHFHSDWAEPRRSEDDPFHVVNTVWLLDDFCAANGATRVVPGSHRLLGTIGDHFSFEGIEQTNPEQIILEAPAGSVIVFNSHLWHSGTRNTSDAARRGVFAYFCAREHEPYINHQVKTSAETRARLSAPARYLLGLEG